MVYEVLDIYQEFNAAMAIAAGKNEEELTRVGMSRPVEFVCDEVADANLRVLHNLGAIVERS